MCQKTQRNILDFNTIFIFCNHRPVFNLCQWTWHFFLVVICSTSQCAYELEYFQRVHVNGSNHHMPHPLACSKQFWAGLGPDQKLNYTLGPSKTLGGRPKIDLYTYPISSYSFRGNYSLLNLKIQRSQYIRPKVKVHKGAETIQGRKLYEEIWYVIFIENK